MKQKWIAINGSPRKSKNTDMIVDYIIEGLDKKNIDVAKYYLNAENIKTCIGCEYCINIDSGTCFIKDEISIIIEEMKNADGYIFASPSYNYNMTAQMKAFLDRTFILNDHSTDTWKSRLSHRKKAIIVGVCKGKNEESMGYTIKGITRTFYDLEVKIIDEIEYYNTKFNPVIDNQNIKEDILNRISQNKELEIET
ncbi:MAG: flavodoxin family protein [Senegalia sp. (in: firmicutes)]|uniref:flavodoxin family protein n=1 Tax=Senegalia sp. (in: firmicutes) TaxID=1924098 RepID=UPI003F97DDD0